MTAERRWTIGQVVVAVAIVAGLTYLGSRDNDSADSTTGSCEAEVLRDAMNEVELYFLRNNVSEARNTALTADDFVDRQCFQP